MVGSRSINEMTTTQFNLSNLKLRVQLIAGECGIQEESFTEEFVDRYDSELDASAPDFSVDGYDSDDKWESWLKVSL